MRTLPDKTRIVQLAHSTVEVDEAGYLFDPSAWSLEFAVLAAEGENVSLGDEHWAVFDFMREFHEEHGVAADARFVIKYLADRHGLDKKAAKSRLFDMFPQGYVKQACKIAGMRQPRAWSTG